MATDAGTQEHRFRKLLVWAALILAVVGLIFAIRGDAMIGGLLVIVGLITAVIVKRRSRLAG